MCRLSFVTVFVAFLLVEILPILSQNVALRSVAVKGTLLCGNTPANGAKVRLFRINSNDMNEVLDTRVVGPSGMFEVNANTNGLAVNKTELIPVVTMYHKCGDDDNKKGYRRFQLGVPREFAGLGRIAKHTYDIGTLNLQMVYPGEVRDKTAE